MEIGLNQRERLIWVDWMKVLGMYFIIAGHINPLGYEYIYVFSVPLFFMISGFLCKYENDTKVFWAKLYRNLLIPIALILAFWFIYNNVSDLIRNGCVGVDIIKLYFINCLEGKVGYKTQIGGGLGVCWFIYTLILCKILFQYTHKVKYIQAIVILICIVLACLNFEYKMLNYNAIANTMLAYPLFVGGAYFRLLYEKSIYKEKVFTSKNSIIYTLLVLGTALVVIIQYYNGTPWLYKADYGNNIILFFVGGISGTLAIYAISRLLPNRRMEWLLKLSNGMIIMLGFHTVFTKLYHVVPIAYKNVVTDYAIVLFIILLFIPIISLFKRFFPVILGYRNIG